MPRKDEIDRMIVLLYHSSNTHGCVNFSRPANWLDRLPMVGLEELQSDLERMTGEVAEEIEKRKTDCMPKFSRKWHESQEADRAAGASLLSQIGVPIKESG